MAVDATARTLIAGRALRGFVDGSVAVLLPAYLLALGHDSLAVGVLGTATLLGSALATLAVGAWGHHAAPRTLLLAAALLMAATGVGFAAFATFAPLLVVAFVGTLNPGAGDVSVFLPLEHARLAGLAQTSAERTALFARYSLAGSLSAAFGALGRGRAGLAGAAPRLGDGRRAAGDVRPLRRHRPGDLGLVPPPAAGGAGRSAGLRRRRRSGPRAR